MSVPLALVLAADQNNLHNTDRQQRRLALGRTPVEKAGGGRELQTCMNMTPSTYFDTFCLYIRSLVEKCTLLPLS